MIPLAADAVTLIGSVVSLLGAAAVIVGLYLSRRSEREANDTQKEAVEAKAKLDEVDALQRVIETVATDAERVNRKLVEANGRADRLNRELGVAQRNVRTLIRTLEGAGVPIPTLEPMHDVN